MADLLDPDLRSLRDAFPLKLSSETLPIARRAMERSTPSPDGIERSEHLADSVPIRMHRPRGVPGPLPCVVSMHGGGFVLGTASMDDALFEEWCPALGLIGISVEYRLAPESPFPGALEDCYAALRWVHHQADDFGIDRARIGVRGMSAGGGLAAAVALLARDRRELPVAFQVLEAPMLDDRMTTASSQLDKLAVWTRESNEFGWHAYLGDLCGTDLVPYTAAPSRAVDLSGLPPALLAVGALDGFHDETVDYAVRLNRAGVPCDLRVYGRACHGFQLVAGSRAASLGARDQIDWLDAQLH